MKRTINLIRLAIKYGGFVMVIVDILQYALDRFDNLKDKEPVKELNNGN